MADSLSASSSSSPSLSSSHSMLLRLPAVLLPLVCSYLSSKGLLVGLSRSSRRVRQLLTSACFSSHSLDLAQRELALLSSRPPSLNQRSFHSRALSDCRLSVNLHSADVSVRRALDSFDHLPACSSLSLHGSNGRKQLSDGDLYSLLHHPTTLSCHHLDLNCLTRPKSEPVSVDDEQSMADVRCARLRRKRSRFSLFSRTKQWRSFDWADIRLPAVTRLHLRLYGTSLYNGGSAFVTAHTALVALEVTTLLVSVAELTSIFHDSAALPHLTRFSLHDHDDWWWRKEKACIRPTLITALATTVVAVSGRVRPMRALNLNLLAPRELFAAAALMPELTSLRVSRVPPGWMEEWSESEQMLSALPQLEELVVHSYWTRADERARHGSPRLTSPSRDMLPFLQSMASRPLHCLELCTAARVTFGAAAMSQLARCHQLRELYFSTGIYSDETAHVDWSDVAVFASFTPACFPHLRSITLHTARLSVESVAAIASAAPQLRRFTTNHVVHGCHPAVVCAVLAGYCEYIEVVKVGDERQHVWRLVQANDVMAAYNSALVSAGRGSGYKPFTQLRHLRVRMCLYTSPSVWHALLSLLRCAVRLQHVAHLWSNDPLVVSSLTYLPSLQSLSSDCVWPASFASHMNRRCKRAGWCGLFKSRQVKETHSNKCPGEGAAFELIDSVAEVDEKGERVRLTLHYDLFTSFQRSLGVARRAVLVRWASGEFRAGDGKLRAAESAKKPSGSLKNQP